jgi:hypothetical protein
MKIKSKKSLRPVDTTGRFCSHARVKFFLPLALLAAFALSACNTIENRRSLYSYEKVEGPYTRDLEEQREHATPYEKTAEQQYQESQRRKRYPKVIEGQKTTIKPSDTGTATPAVQPTSL